MSSNNGRRIEVTQPFMPPLEEFEPLLTQIWENKWLTNNGPFHQQLEGQLRDYLGVENISLISNGTLALIIALQALRITGDVITTPFSFVATTHALHWNGIRPIFVDIDPETFNLDPSRIEAAITPSTTAILPVHVYGVPCAMDRIQQIADTYGLKVLYDAAHAFGVRAAKSSIYDTGDISILSFHATKVFSTFEGGAIIANGPKLKQRVDFLKNFGFADEVTVVGPGINAKMSEIHAAFGLVQLQHIGSMLQARRSIAARYRALLADVKGLRIPEIPAHVEHNGAYFPILVEDSFPLSRDELYARLRSADVYARRYFYPLISEFPTYRGLPSAVRGNLPVAHRVSHQVLCLPIHPNLSHSDQDRIAEIVTHAR